MNDLNKILNATTKMQIDFSGFQISFDVRLNVINQTLLSSLGEGVDANYRFLGKCIAGWDIMDGDKPFPLNEETISQLPILLVTTLMERISQTVLEQRKSLNETNTIFFE